MGDKGKRGVKNLKKWVMSFMDSHKDYYVFLVLTDKNL